MSWKITIACLLTASLTLGACAPLIIVGTAVAAGGLTASELRTVESGAAESAPRVAPKVAPKVAPSETSKIVAAPLESVESRSLE